MFFKLAYELFNNIIHNFYVKYCYYYSYIIKKQPKSAALVLIINKKFQIYFNQVLIASKDFIKF